MSTPKGNKEALGKGIRSLLQGIDSDLKNTAGSLKPQAVQEVTGALRIPVDQVETNPKQPRKHFDEQALQELAQSLKLHDMIQPVTVSKLHGTRYRLFRANAAGGQQSWPACLIFRLIYARPTTSSCWNWLFWKTCSAKT
jgi:hypothetical protein